MQFEAVRVAATVVLASDAAAAVWIGSFAGRMADTRKGELRCRARGDAKQGECEEAPDAVSSLPPCPLSGTRPRTLTLLSAVSVHSTWVGPEARYLGGLIGSCWYIAHT